MVEVYVDGASSGNPGPSGIGVLIGVSENIKQEYKEHIGEATNNVAEATALLRALEIIDEKYITFGKAGAPFVIHTDSAVVHGHLTRHWKCNTPSLQAIYDKILDFGDKINYELKLIPGNLNPADKLAKSATKMDKPLEAVVPGHPDCNQCGTDDSGKLDREPGTDAAKEWKKDLEAAKSLEGVRLTERLVVAKPYYRLHHDLVFRSVIVHKYPVDKYGKPIEMGEPIEVARMSEEAAIQLIIMSRMGQLKVSE